MPGTAAKIVISEKQQKLLQEFSKSRTVGKCVAQRAMIILLGFAGLLNEQIALQVGLNLGFGKHKPVSVGSRLKEGMKLGPLELMAVPGHTSGCIAFWWAAQRALIAGDTVATWPVLDLGWPTFNLDPASARRSVGKMAELSTCEILGVGHGDPILVGGAQVLKELKSK